jgi:hypothetical protein
MTSSCPTNPRPGSLVEYGGKTYKLMAYIGMDKVALRPPEGGVETWVPLDAITIISASG